MPDSAIPLRARVVLVTGGAKRIGAEIVRTLHGAGMTVAIQFRSSRAQADQLAAELNAVRGDSAFAIHADLLHTRRMGRLIDKVIGACGRLDVVVNNASSFYATPIGAIGEDHWADLVGTNLKAPLFLAQAAAPHLEACQGCIVNIVDIHGQRPLKNYAVYSAAKAGLIMLTRALARDLGPAVRVNAVAPGAILWPEAGLDEVAKRRVISSTALKRQGEPADIARAVLFLIREGNYCTGEVLGVDGGRLLSG